MKSELKEQNSYETELKEQKLLSMLVVQLTVFQHFVSNIVL
jgi:hypothetical protein